MADMPGRADVIYIYGASDDLVEVEGSIREEFMTYDGLTLRVARFDGLGNVEGLMVAARYEDNGCWSIAPYPLEEGFALPWLVSVDFDEYSTRLAIACPDDVTVTVDE